MGFHRPHLGTRRGAARQKGEADEEVNVYMSIFIVSFLILPLLASSGRGMFQLPALTNPPEGFQEC